MNTKKIPGKWEKLGTRGAQLELEEGESYIVFHREDKENKPYLLEAKDGVITLSPVLTSSPEKTASDESP